jgi:electron-transferring-flavoprotein dehydrogenase
MGLVGLSGGRLSAPADEIVAIGKVRTAEEYYDGSIPAAEITAIREECRAEGRSLHDALMNRAGWPEIPYDGQLLVTQQDALLLGGKVMAGPGMDHVVFLDGAVCEACRAQVCVEVCSGEAIRPGPVFDREKCVHCGACVWNCGSGNVEFLAGAGGLHSAEN